MSVIIYTAYILHVSIVSPVVSILRICVMTDLELMFLEAAIWIVHLWITLKSGLIDLSYVVPS